MISSWFARLKATLAKATEIPLQDDTQENAQNAQDGWGTPSKSTLARQRMAERGGIRTSGTRLENAVTGSRSRVPPGQTVTENWPRLDDGKIPSKADKDWSVAVSRQNGDQVAVSLDDIRTMPMTSIVADIHCVTGWSRLDMSWKGVSLEAFAACTGMDIRHDWAMVHSSDGYCANLPLSRLLGKEAMLALEADGQPLTREHGGPVRLLVPSLYLWKSVKWVSALETIPADRRGTWENRGYHNAGDPWLEQRWRMAEKPEDGYPQK